MFLDKDSLYMDGISMGQFITQVKFGYHKLWSSDSGRALSGKQSGTLIGIFPKFTLSFRSLTESELKFIYHYPDIAARVMTVSPFYEPSGELQKRLDKGSIAMPHHII